MRLGGLGGLILLWVFMWTGAAESAEGASGKAVYPPIGVDNPFLTEQARRNLISAVDYPIPKDFLDTAPNITYYGYEIEPLKTCPSKRVCQGKNAEDFLVFRRVVRSSLAPIETKIREALANAEEHGCSYSNIRDFALGYALPDMVQYEASLSYTKRWCDDILGSHDVAHASGRLIIRGYLAKTPPSYGDVLARGEVKVVPDVSVTGVSGDLFRLIDMNGIGRYIASYILAGIPGVVIAEEQVKHIREQIDKLTEMDFNSFVVFLQSGIKSFQEFAELINLIFGSIGDHVYMDFLDVENTGFICNPKCELQFSEIKFVPKDYAEFVYGFRVCEINFIKSLSEPESSTYKVRQGDSLWSIAERIYCSGEMYLYLNHLNPELKKPKAMPIGAEIRVSPSYKYLALKKNIVERGDSLWKRWVGSARLQSWKEFRQKTPVPSVSADKIYPLQVNFVDQPH